MTSTLAKKSSTRRLRPASVSITPVKLGLDYHDIVPNWYANNPFLTAMFNALSAQFPPGEAFLIQSARLFRDQVTDPELKKDVAGFIGQEAHHAREHEQMSQALQAIGVPTDLVETQVQKILDLMCKYLPEKDQMAATAALEHFTSMLGTLVLANPDLLAEVDPSVQPLFIWHAIEESEHKAVAFDLYQDTVGSYPRLMIAYLWTTTTLVLLNSYFQLRLMAKDGSLLNIGATLKGLNWMFGFGKNAGHFRRMLPEVLTFFRPNFHPWEQDNSADIAYWKGVLAQLTKTQGKRKSATQTALSVV